MHIYAKIISQRLSLPEEAVSNTLALLDEGCTIPFISRYRKERTGGLNEVQIGLISDWNDKLKELSKRKTSILKTIEGQGKLSEELRQRIENSWDATEIEDIYLPFKPKRRTRAQVAREQGLEPLAHAILQQHDNAIGNTARKLLTLLQAQHAKEAQQKDSPFAFLLMPPDEQLAHALQGAKDIIAEEISESEGSRKAIRGEYRRGAIITSKVVKSKQDSDEAQRFADYFDFSEPLRRCSSHRLLAMRRGERLGILRVSITADDDECMSRLRRHYVHGSGVCQQLVGEASDDAFKRLLKPSIENEFDAESKSKADDEAVAVFAENLRQLLLAPPLGQKRVMAVDPGFANGCKIVCLDEQGNLLHHEIVYPLPPRRYYAQASVSVMKMISQYHIEAIAIGNGTASREAKDFINDIITLPSESKVKKPSVFVVSEDGASIYSASATAREEFPNEDVTVRGAVSIGRRLMDPLAELVKIDPKSIGVGQYQHDVEQSKLKHSLDQTVENCVNHVGVNVNTASQHLLNYVSGLGPTLAKNIVNYRREHGPFTSRVQLKKVPRLGPTAFQQCAGFLRIPGARNPLDNSAVHPESYGIVEQMAADQGCSVGDLIGNEERCKAISLKKYVGGNVGLPTLNDIRDELLKPGRDPRGEVEEFSFDEHVHTLDDLQEGMVLPGIVTNITKFGAFVDIGVHQDGLVHVSQMADKYVADPTTVVHLHQHVRVKVIEVDERRGRISLSMKGIK